MIEDDSYRASSQYRLWSYTKESLARIRHETNQLASDRVKAAFRRAHTVSRAAQNGGSHDGALPNEANQAEVSTVEIETLTVDEELKIVEWGCSKIVDMGEAMNPRIPSHVVVSDLEIRVHLLPFLFHFTSGWFESMRGRTLRSSPCPARTVTKIEALVGTLHCMLPTPTLCQASLTSSQATAIQYLRRFYLTNSPMTYHPKQILPSALYLATKSDHFYISLSRFAAELNNISEDDVKAPEFLLLQGLRFTLDIRHPMKGLQGGHVEMNVLAEEGRLGGAITKATGSEQRIGRAADQAKKLLATAAQMTDAYFLYSPSQIWLAAMMLADRGLVDAYINHKIQVIADLTSQPTIDVATFQTKLVTTISSCATLLQSYTPPEEESATQRKEMRRIGKKLNVCQNPEKMDIVAVAKARVAEKREGTGSGSDAEKVLKKRRLERERAEKDGEVFGGDLQDIKTKQREGVAPS
jgi:cyclin H